MGGDTFSLIWLVLFLPLAGFLVQALLGKLIVTRLGVTLRAETTVAEILLADAGAEGAKKTVRALSHSL